MLSYGSAVPGGIFMLILVSSSASDCTRIHIPSGTVISLPDWTVLIQSSTSVTVTEPSPTTSKLNFLAGFSAFTLVCDTPNAET